ncbi:glycoside hydrolase family 125 protein [Rariglobus hedericola]|uniref:Glycoside hydrolase family 125 protein n=1 Tax=Rariglobus hedericola TaxID=2597822 RepID=A0A556QPG4_9BACT|nr:glycoside hydrolase family 125 protein [Rariglobus hedericola]TSJ78534.1 glycoside hydrolase family 125 protein [Rariglobus hedericola]
MPTSPSLPSQRPAPDQRRFKNAAIEALITDVSSAIADPELAWLFTNCLPNTLDTTVDHRIDEKGSPDTYVITGDIPAMWLRDSAAQIWPYLPLARTDIALRSLIAGVIRRQTDGVLLDPYANAFYREPVLGEWKDDDTEMRPGVHERKWEIDSLAYFLRLSHGYWAATGDASPFDEHWRHAVAAVFSVIRVEQASGDPDGNVRSPYSFVRPGQAHESLPCDGYGLPSRTCGLIRCGFRPSDDRVAYPFLVSANAMMAVSLRNLSLLLDALACAELATQAKALATEINRALDMHAVVQHPSHGEIWAYEVDGLGGINLMDDANIPSLISLPYFGFCAKDDPRYLRTRAFLLSTDNPQYVAGKAARGIGGPHTGPGTIWPMALIMQALTATEDTEILECLRYLKTTHAGTGFMHESFHGDDAHRFTRHWFAWANTLFGELIVTLYHQRRHLLASHPA